MKTLIFTFSILLMLAVGFFLFSAITKPKLITVASNTSSSSNSSNVATKDPRELLAESLQKSSDVHGVYMTGEVAGDGKSLAADKIRTNIEDMVRKKEINAVVIDVKEVDGTEFSDTMKNTVKELHSLGAWVIARIVSFKDNSQINVHPDYYIKNPDGTVWKDKSGGGWMDPDNPNVWDYLSSVGKKAISYGFDELQFDYVRFPSDGNLRNMRYPYYVSKIPKHEIIKNFLDFIHKDLRATKPDIILSADLFGYVATQGQDVTIGQNVTDLPGTIDYVSFMVYPSHYYSGFEVPADPLRNLPALYYSYRSRHIKNVVSNQPYDVVFRSILRGMDFMSGILLLDKNETSSSTASTTIPVRDIPQVRPWLQDFNLGVDTSRGIYYDAKKVEAEIKAADDAGSKGWLLWNASNVYTEDAIKANIASSTTSG